MLNLSGGTLRKYLLTPIFFILFTTESVRGEAFSSMYSDATIFVNAIEKERPTDTPKLATTGITTPHHLLAADLIARAFWTTSGNRYERIVILSPDHFRRSHHVIATTRQSFETVFGLVPVDVEAVDNLLSDTNLAETSGLFASEHGIGAVLPFVRYFLPDTPIVPVTLSISSTPAEWEAAAELLRKIVTSRTLVVQSTDFSHYLPAPLASARDQETLNVLSDGSPSAIARLRQSSHLDSKASQFVQMVLQKSVFGSHATIIGNRNQVEYAPLSRSTTSYIVVVYTRAAHETSTLRYNDQKVFYFGGDVFPGRWLTAALVQPEKRSQIIDVVRTLTGGGPMIVNLEGVMMDDPPPGLSADLHVFTTAVAAPVLKGFNVVVAGIANNHSFDLGAGGLKEMRRSLSRLNIKPLEHLKVIDLGAFRLVALNFIGARSYAQYPVMRAGDLERLCRMTIRPPVVALVHWGEEYTVEPSSTVIKQAEAIHRCGVVAIVGAHTHRAVSGPASMWGGEFQMTYSLGNLLFDQHSPRASGAILEMRVFAQQTIATRIIAAPNFFDNTNPTSDAMGSKF
ncbi:AmmeMemoRadiSam system protein B [Bradyrhizobium sp. AUGA SZCCT0240]|uniref:AmmeMemoRadiSam system protein B n=1 Tax=Bradyrhizobium sp. AUGA SZCCT0240 TaxID=2807669 RepID=UPI001BABBB0A|nr:AmmeMemoRadiSam system protein B [Bradyrhizobium sp. AUGA SZCCT0240]MBR1255185.1 AmmeMemoRadiSam system protein B [Bradyrhizobium sp. AUGA SZCCT0240]